MSTSVYSRVVANAYYDSVTLMKCATSMETVAGIGKVGLMMGTPANRTLLAEQNLWDAEDDRAGPTDLCVSMTYESEAGLERALAQLDAFLSGQQDTFNSNQPAGGGGVETVRSWKEAAAVMGQPKVAAISVPGAWASTEAQQALDQGFHVFLYSDNVSIEEEAALKSLAAEKGLIVMGPDCGTALLSGVPLGFVNRVVDGHVGLIAASGTGAQEVSSALSRAGVGLSHIIGIGGRDLTAEIHAVSFRTALEWFGSDPRTEVVGIVAKPPDRQVLNELIPTLETFEKPVAALFLGASTLPAIPGVTSVSTIGELVSALADTAPEVPPTVPGLQPGTFVRGLFVGGTLAIQASYILGIPLASEGLSPWTEPTHVIVDLGADRFTVSRPHPMLDGAYRGRALKEALLDPRTGMILGDLVLGDGAEGDPATHVIEAVKAARAERPSLPTMVFTVVGTELDPQNYEGQIQQLVQAGVWVTNTSTAAASAVKQAMEGHSHD